MSDQRWRWLTADEREKRKVAIWELWDMGYPAAEIAARYDLSVQRVRQIIYSRR